ncbi:MAG: NADH-quinone oxidoreductase subunit NuoE [Phycisphaera sp.]|nr:MAG: NADH-quinone oxidoreductase subunit NuoE [Phycisphaera sp.]
MAWITKNSAGATIERRDEPYLTDEMRKHLGDEILPRYETTLGALLPALHEIQHTYGWIPPQAMHEIADFLQVPPSDVIDTVTFYEEYWTNPKGEHVVAVCRSIACEFCGQGEVTQACKDKLGIDVGETTEDGKYTLIELECLGACGGAPAMLVDEKLHEFVKPGEVSSHIDDAPKHSSH